MRVRLRVLAVGVAVVSVAVAGCSSKTSGSSGAVQDEVSASSSAVPSAGAASGAAVASTAASPSGSPSASFGNTKNTTNNDVCDSGLEYACGSTGPGGGTVYYASSVAFPCGADMTSSCNFLEVAPNLWDPDSQHGCSKQSPCGGSNQNTSDFSFSGKGITYCTGGSGQTGPIAGALGNSIGWGYANTTALLAVCSSADAGSAARRYTGGGMTDWSLPSFSELQALAYYPERANIGGFNSQFYWSSSVSTALQGGSQQIQQEAVAAAMNAMPSYQWRNRSLPYGARPTRSF